MKRLLFISLIVSFILIGCDGNHSNSSSSTVSRSNGSNNDNYQPTYSRGPMGTVDDEGYEYSMFDTRAPARNGEKSRSRSYSSNSEYDNGYEEGYEDGYRKGRRDR